MPLERSIAHLLRIGIHLAVVVLAVGVAGLVVGGISPLGGAPALDPSVVAGDLVALRPAGFLWAGVVLLVATPSARVIAALIRYRQIGETTMAIVSVLILVVVLASVALALVEP